VFSVFSNAADKMVDLKHRLLRTYAAILSIFYLRTVGHDGTLAIDYDGTLAIDYDGTLALDYCQGGMASSAFCDGIQCLLREIDGGTVDFQAFSVRSEDQLQETVDAVAAELSSKTLWGSFSVEKTITGPWFDQHGLISMVCPRAFF
jgi:hypothetical protein